MPLFNFDTESWTGFPSLLPFIASPGILGLSTLLLVLVLVARRPRANDDIALLKGPSPTSLLVGSYTEFHRSAPGIVTREWAKRFGRALRMKGVLGEDVLIISDPSALNHMFNTSPSKYDVHKERADMISTFWGPVVSSVRGEHHTRHRRVLQPAFGAVAVGSMKAMFDHTTVMLVEKLDQLLLSEKKANQASDVIDMGRQIVSTTLDAIWLAGFGTDLGSIANPDSPHIAPYTGMENRAQTGINCAPVTVPLILVRTLVGALPTFLQKLVMKLDKQQARAAMESIGHGRRIARRLIQDKMQNIAQGEDPGADVLGRLVKANLEKTSRYHFDSTEMEGSVSVLHFAGHETNASSISWVFHLLSTHQDTQHAVRAELLAALEASPSDTLSREELDSLPLFNAVIKETLRTHPGLPYLPRQAMSNDVFPLSTPITLRNGTTKSSLAILKGTAIMVDVAAVQHDVDIWGPDAGEWKPERWLDGRYGKELTRIPGPYANLMTFAAGPRLCIGWLFALLELQTVASRLLTNFHFDPVPGVEIESLLGAVDMVSVVGDPKGRGKLPLRVRRI